MKIVITDKPDHTYGATTPNFEVAFQPRPFCLSDGRNYPALFDLLVKHSAITLPDDARFYPGCGTAVYWKQDTADFDIAREFAEQVQAAISQSLADFQKFEAMLKVYDESHAPK